MAGGNEDRARRKLLCRPRCRGLERLAARPSLATRRSSDLAQTPEIHETGRATVARATQDVAVTGRAVAATRATRRIRKQTADVPMTIPETMRAVLLTGHGDLDRLVFTDSRPTPAPGPGQVLIRVAACGLNNTDVNTRTAWYSKGVSDATTGDAFDTRRRRGRQLGRRGDHLSRASRARTWWAAWQAVGEGANAALVGRRVLVDTWLRDWERPAEPRQGGLLRQRVRRRLRRVHGGGPAQRASASSPTSSDAELATFATSYVTAENMLNRAAGGRGRRRARSPALPVAWARR